MEVFSEYSEITMKPMPLDLLYDQWILSREVFAHSMAVTFGSFPVLISVSRRTYLFLYCYAMAHGSFSNGNWFCFGTGVEYDYQLEDDEMVLCSYDKILCVLKGIKMQLFDVQV